MWHETRGTGTDSETEAPPSFVSSFPIQMNALIAMGFADAILNESVLTRHGGNLQQTANSLLEKLHIN